MPRQYGTLDDEMKAKIAKARSRGEWFYCSRYERWMTPDEYQEAYEYHKITGSPENIGWLRDYEGADPKSGIRSRLSTVNKAMLELETFTKMVFEYCNLIERDKL